MTSSAISKRYAKALLSVAIEQKLVAEVRKDVEQITALMKASEDFVAFIKNPLIQPRIKAQIFEGLFAGKLQQITRNFLAVLAFKQRERDLEQILIEFIRQLDEQEGIVAVQVKSAVALSDEQKKAISQKISNYTKSRVRLETTIDPILKGGFVVKLGDTTFDGSLSTQLMRLREQLARG